MRCEHQFVVIEVKDPERQSEDLPGAAGSSRWETPVLAGRGVAKGDSTGSVTGWNR